MNTALTVAGSDSGGGAGIQADLKTFAALGVYGTCAIAAVTAQNTMGVTGFFTLPSDIIVAQMEAVASDIGVDAVKTGMLATAAVVEVVAAAITDLELPHVVVDPVMIAKSGDRLLEEEAVSAIRAELLRRAFVVTPNAPEAEILAGIPVRTPSDAREAARRILKLGPAAVLVKGGHLDTEEIVDLLYDGHRFTEMRGPRLESRNSHGSGCTLAAALTANLALGRPLVEAAQLARDYVVGAIRHGLPIGRGRGPMDHFWNGVARPVA